MKRNLISGTRRVACECYGLVRLSRLFDSSSIGKFNYGNVILVAFLKKEPGLSDRQLLLNEQKVDSLKPI